VALAVEREEVALVWWAQAAGLPIERPAIAQHNLILVLLS